MFTLQNLCPSRQAESTVEIYSALVTNVLRFILFR